MYSKQEHKNEWNGAGLLAGVYFYVFLNNNRQELRVEGYVSIVNRNPKVKHEGATTNLSINGSVYMTE